MSNKSDERLEWLVLSDVQHVADASQLAAYDSATIMLEHSRLLQEGLITCQERFTPGDDSTHGHLLNCRLTADGLYRLRELSKRFA